MDATSTYGLLSLVPVAIVIVMALITKRTLESLIVGSMVGFIILDGTGFFTAWMNSALTVFGDSAWYILVFGVFGMIIMLLENPAVLKAYRLWAPDLLKAERWR